MKKLNLVLEHCHGIRKLEETLDYSKSSTVAIYAPNGAMKSSLAKTFKDIADGTTSNDRVFPGRAYKRLVQDDSGSDLAPDGILVLRSYEDVPAQGAETATLLVNQALRQEYEALHADISIARDAFIKAVKAQAKTKREVDREISAAFMANDDQLDAALHHIRDELAENDWPQLATVPYDVVMDDKVQAFLETGDFKIAIDDYIKKYNEIIATSRYFKKGTFNYYNATNVAKQLKENGFFQARHTVNLNGDERIEITSEGQIEELVRQEKEKISNDRELRKRYAALEKQIQKNAALRDFEAYMQEHEDLLPELADCASFKKKLWKSYIKAKYEMFVDLLDNIQRAAERTEEILKKADQEKSIWHEVVNIFNDRFVVPFRLEVENRVKVTLGLESVPRLKFVFTECGDEAPVDRDSLLQTLSTGEKKAFYVLNMLFDIAVRRQSGRETLIVVDDIADSFDYKNKYAIIQYLADLAEDPKFKLLILTHNFDFYRTIESRKLVQRSNCFMVSKTDHGVKLQGAVGIKNVFVNLWKPNFYVDRKMKICCISFMRNLIEYTKGDEDDDYIRLTSLLHWKPDTNQITVADLDEVYGRLFSNDERSLDGAEKVVELIEKEANACLLAPEGVNFENKIVLAIATRLQAEKFMVAKINDVEWLANVDANQTQKLLKRYCEKFEGEAGNIRLLKRVSLMTPENIHLNSFMYEPILDMSDQHLRSLYTEVSGLQ